MPLATKNEEAFAGVAIRPGEEVDAYYWDWLTSDERVLFSQIPVLLIGPAPRHWYWRQVERGKLIAWKGCHTALLGVGALPGKPRVSIYDRTKIEAAMQLVGSERGLTGSIAPQAVADKVAHLWVSHSVTSTDLGELTPYYI